MRNAQPSKNITLVLVNGWYWLQVARNGVTYLICRKGRAGDCIRP